MSDVEDQTTIDYFVRCRTNKHGQSIWYETTVYHENRGPGEVQETPHLFQAARFETCEEAEMIACEINGEVVPADELREELLTQLRQARRDLAAYKHDGRTRLLPVPDKPTHFTLTVRLPSGDEREESYAIDKVVDPSSSLQRVRYIALSSGTIEEAEQWGRAIVDRYNHDIPPALQRTFVSVKWETE